MLIVMIYFYPRINKFIFSELYPKQQKKDWFKVNYQPFDREIKFHIVHNTARESLKKKKVVYPIKFISCDYKNAPLLLK